MTEDEIVGWHHRLNGNEFEQAPRVGDGQGSLVCCSPWSCKEVDTTEQLPLSLSSAYLKLLIFLMAVWIPACTSSSAAFHMIYSAYKLNKQGDSTQH